MILHNKRNMIAGRGYGIYFLFSLLVLTSLSCKVNKLASNDKPTSPEDKEFFQAKKYIEDGENLNALTLFSSLVRAQPQNPNYLYGYALSKMLYNLHRTADILQKLFEVIKDFTSSSGSRTQQYSQQSRVFIDGLLEAIFRIIILDTVDNFARDMAKFFNVAKDDFVFDIQKFTINFFAGGKSVEKFTIFGKHGIEEANLLYAISQIIRTVVYSFLSLSFNVDFEDVWRVFKFTEKNGGSMSLFAYPLTVGFPSLVYLLEKNQNVLTLQFKGAEDIAKEALPEAITAIYKYSSSLVEKFSKGNLRKDFMIFFGEDRSAYMKAALGDEAPKIIQTTTEGIKGIEETVVGAKIVLESLQGKALVRCDDIVGPVGTFWSILSRSGFLLALAKVGEESAPEEAKAIAQDFYRTIIYYIDWFSAIYSACTKNAFLFDFSKLWTALENLRGAFPVWFSLDEKDYIISMKRNILIEWECQTSTYDLKFERLERNFNWLFCKKKSTFEDSEHFSVPITFGKGITSVLGIEVVNGENPFSKNPIPPDGIPTPYPYIILPEPSFKGLIRLNTKVFWPDCRVPCGFPCEVIEPSGIEGLCLMNAALAKIGNFVYGVE